MNQDRKVNLFAKLAAQQVKADPPAPVETPAPSPAPPPAPLAEVGKGRTSNAKREKKEYCQANAYVLKSVRRAVERELIDLDELDYSTLVETLLRDWLTSRGVSC